MISEFNALKNHLSVIKSRCDNVNTNNVNNLIEIVDIKQLCDSFISFIDKLENIQENNSKPNGKKQLNSFVDMIVSKIDILKNIIKEKIGDDTFISVDLISVEEIESEILRSGTMNKNQMELLNSIYKKNIKEK